MDKEFELVVRKVKNDEVVKFNREFLENACTIAKAYATQYQYYYYVPTLREEFNGQYAYFYKDLFSNHLIKVNPSDIDKRTSILREKTEEIRKKAEENGIKEVFYIGFSVPYYE